MRITRALSGGLSKWGCNLNSDIKINIEKHWRDYVINANSKSSLDGKKCYILSMFPYPSGHLHMGHVRVYAISDCIARFKKMNGMCVIHPMGWDAFGLPAENAAIEREINPNDWTNQNVSKMKEQLLNLGCSFNWEREINTSDVQYYKWTQYLFLELYNTGLAYKKDALVNWDPVDQTVLAEEQVNSKGFSWRSGAKVEKKLLNQWFIKTTQFAKQLYDGLEDPELSGWKDIVQLQKHWIGECNGISIDFSLSYKDASIKYVHVLTGWTQKPESLLCTKFIAVPPSSFLNKPDLISHENENFKRLIVDAVNPLTNEKIPIFVTSQVDYPEGCDAYIGSPDVNECDKDFASMISLSKKTDSQFFAKSEQEIENIRKKVCEMALSKRVGGYLVSSKLKDWLISRQRYWGTPIPIVYCKSCGPKPVSFEDLPIVLPRVKFGHSLKKSDEWISTSCPECGRDAVRETDTMDTFVDSSWYFLRYLDPKNTSLPFSKDIAFRDMPVDLYIGGKEHAVLHLYYARFMNHFLHSIGKLPQREPFRRLLVQGMVRGKSFRIKQCGKYIKENEVKIIDEKKGLAVTVEDNLPVEIGWEKMSKSKYNGVDPADMFKEYGSDTTRLLMLADVAPTSGRNWSSDTFPGVLRWQNKLWQLTSDFITARKTLDELKDKETLNSQEFKISEKSIWENRNFLVAEITFSFNYTYVLSAAVTRMLGLTTILKKVPKTFIGISSEFEVALAHQLLMLAPIAPHFACELWAGLRSVDRKVQATHGIDWNKDILDQRWPTVDDHYPLDIIVVLNGANLGKLKILPEELNCLTKDKALELATKLPTVQKALTKDIHGLVFNAYPGCRGYLKISTIKDMNIKKGNIENVI